MNVENVFVLLLVINGVQTDKLVLPYHHVVKLMIHVEIVLLLNLDSLGVISLTHVQKFLLNVLITMITVEPVSVLLVRLGVLMKINVLKFLFVVIETIVVEDVLHSNLDTLGVNSQIHVN